MTCNTDLCSICVSCCHLLKVEVVTKVRSSIGSKARDICLSTRNTLLLFQTPLCSWQEFRFKQGRTGHVHPSDTGIFVASQARKSVDLRPDAHSRPWCSLRQCAWVASQTSFRQASSCNCAIKCASLIDNMVPLSTIPCPRNSSTRDHSLSAPAESENDDQRLLQTKMSRAATRGKPAQRRRPSSDLNALGNQLSEATPHSGFFSLSMVSALQMPRWGRFCVSPFPQHGNAIWSP